MKVRPMTLADMHHVVAMYLALMREEQAALGCTYPRLHEQSPDEIEKFLTIQLTKNPLFHAVVGVLGEKPKAVATCYIEPRQSAVRPIAVCNLNVIYIMPQHRQKFARTGQALVHACWEWGFRALAPFVPDEAERTLEGATTPGTQAEALWKAAGLVPYRLSLAFVGPDGRPHRDVPRLTGVRVAASPESATPEPCTAVQPAAVEGLEDGQHLRGRERVGTGISAGTS